MREGAARPPATAAHPDPRSCESVSRPTRSRPRKIAAGPSNEADDSSCLIFEMPTRFPVHGMNKQVPRKFGQRQLVDAALELDDRIKRHPVVVPSPRIELRLLGGAQGNIGIAP